MSRMPTQLQPLPIVRPYAWTILDNHGQLDKSTRLFRILNFLKTHDISRPSRAVHGQVDLGGSKLHDRLKGVKRTSVIQSSFPDEGADVESIEDSSEPIAGWGWVSCGIFEWASEWSANDGANGSMSRWSNDEWVSCGSRRSEILWTKLSRPSLRWIDSWSMLKHVEACWTMWTWWPSRPLHFQNLPELPTGLTSLDHATHATPVPPILHSSRRQRPHFWPPQVALWPHGNIWQPCIVYIVYSNHGSLLNFRNMAILCKIVHVWRGIETGNQALRPDCPAESTQMEWKSWKYPRKGWGLETRNLLYSKIGKALDSYRFIRCSLQSPSIESSWGWPMKSLHNEVWWSFHRFSWFVFMSCSRDQDCSLLFFQRRDAELCLAFCFCFVGLDDLDEAALMFSFFLVSVLACCQKNIYI